MEGASPIIFFVHVFNAHVLCKTYPRANFISYMYNGVYMNTTWQYCIYLLCCFIAGPQQIIRTCVGSVNVKFHWSYVCIQESRPGDGSICFCDDDLCNAGSSHCYRSHRYLHVSMYIAVGIITIFLMDMCSSRQNYQINELVGMFSSLSPISVLVAMARTIKATPEEWQGYKKSQDIYLNTW